MTQMQGQRRALAGERRTVAVQPLGRERYLTGSLAGLAASAFKEAMWYWTPDGKRAARSMI
jgi:hypothetical protein